MSIRALGGRVGALPVVVMAEVGMTIFGLYLLSGGALSLSPMTSQPSDTVVSDEGSALSYVLLSGIYLVSLVLTLRQPKASWRAATADLCLVTLVGFTVASTAWSSAPDVTLRRALALVGTSFFGIYLTVRYRVEQRLWLVGVVFGFITLLNLLLALSYPGMVSDGSFAGSFDTKNGLGRMMALATLVFIGIAEKRRLRTIAGMAAVVSFGLVVVAKSATAIMVLLTTLSLIPLFRMFKRDVRIVVVLGTAAVLLLGVIALFAAPTLDAVTSLLGRDATLTGRTSLWPLVVAMILRRPWLGYGYEAFWLWEGGLRATVDEAAGWTPAQAHNGFLDVGLALGLTGLLLFGFAYARATVRAVALRRREETSASLWPLVYLCFLFLYNLTESTALTRNSLFWVLFVSALVSVSPKWGQGKGQMAQSLKASDPPPPGTDEALAVRGANTWGSVPVARL